MDRPAADRRTAGGSRSDFSLARWGPDDDLKRKSTPAKPAPDGRRRPASLTRSSARSISRSASKRAELNQPRMRPGQLAQITRRHIQQTGGGAEHSRDASPADAELRARSSPTATRRGRKPPNRCFRELIPTPTQPTAAKPEAARTNSALRNECLQPPPTIQNPTRPRM